MISTKSVQEKVKHGLLPSSLIKITTQNTNATCVDDEFFTRVGNINLFAINQK